MQQAREIELLNQDMVPIKNENRSLQNEINHLQIDAVKKSVK